MSKKLFLFPFGGNAREALLSVLAANEKNQEWDIMGFIDDDQAKHGKECCGVKVLGGKETIKRVVDAFILAVPGNPANYYKRADIIDSLQIDKSRFASIIHPSVVIAPDAMIGYNTLIMPNVVVSCGVKIGNHCIFLPNTIVSHDSVVGDYCCLGSNISISGSVKIDKNCYVGSGTKVRENVSVGERTLLGLGSNVLSDIGSEVIAAGNPAKVIKRSIP